jgi:hypothetical protein
LVDVEKPAIINCVNSTIRIFHAAGVNAVLEPTNGCTRKLWDRFIETVNATVFLPKAVQEVLTTAFLRDGHSGLVTGAPKLVISE